MSTHRDSTPRPAPPVLFPIVGIGGGAGSDIALPAFLRRLPPEPGMAFVILLRLATNRAKQLLAQVQVCTPLIVQWAAEGLRLQPNQIYLAPPGQLVTLVDDQLHLTPRASDQGRDLSGFQNLTGLSIATSETGVQKHPPLLDPFFASLAATGADRVALLLSGTGHDGVQGMLTVKAQGGLTLVQAPTEAAQPALLRRLLDQARTEHPPDKVAPVAELADYLILMRQPLATTEPIDEDSPLSEENVVILNQILSQVYTHTGHDFSYYKRSTLLRRIGRRQQVHSLTDLAAYLEFLRQTPDEAQALYKECLVSVTNFFRDPEAFAALENSVIPQLFVGKKYSDTVRVWVIGCATGEEAYSVAMLLRERMVELTDAPHLQVFATDIDEEALAFARRGLYAHTIASQMNQARLQRFFLEEKEGYRIKLDLRETVLFAMHNVLKDPPFSKLDLITCRNVLIYFTREAQEKSFDVFHYALHVGSSTGYLFLGTSESADGAATLFATLDKRYHLYQRHQTITGVARRVSTTFTGVSSKPTEAIDRPLAGALRPKPPSVEELYQQWTLRKYAPPRVLVDANYAITHVFNGAGRYLRDPEGEVTQNILQKVRPELRLDLRSALYQAFHKNERSDSRLIQVDREGEECFVQLHVGPVAEPGFPRELVEVVFEERKEEIVIGASHLEAMHNLADSELVISLEEELLRTRDRLQTIMEEHESSTQEMKAANEELQSINEELKSTSEELETSKEELQSMNEELVTVNHELKLKIEELSRANSDLLNLISSTDVGVIFLDQSLRVKRFTPRATELFHLIETDLGRPFAHIAHRIRNGRPLEYAAHVLETLEPVEEIIQSDDERWYMLRLFLYRTIDQMIDGVVITFIDISDLKRAESEVQQRIQQQVVAELGRQALSSNDDLPTLLTSATTRLAQTLEMDLCGVFAWHSADQEERLQLVTGVGWPEELLGQAQIDMNPVYPSWVALAQDEPVVIEEIGQVKQLRFAPLFQQQGAVSGVSVVIGGNGRPYGVLSVYSKTARSFSASDIDFVQAIANLLGEALAREQTAQELRASEDRFRTLADAAPALVWVCDRDGNITYMNARWYEYTGQTVAEAAGYGWAATMHPDDAGAILPYWQHCQQTGEVYQGEVRYRRQDGAYRWHLFRALPQRNADGLILAWYGCSIDVHDAKVAEDALRQSEQRLNLALNAAHMVAWEWDPMRNQIVTTDNFHALYGLPTLAGAEQGFTLVHPDDVTAHRDKVQQVAGNGGAYHSEFRIHRLDNGQQVWLEEWGYGVTNGAGQVAKLVGVVRDTTERKQTELHQQFLLDLDADTRLLDNAVAILATTAARLGQYLGVTHCTFNEIDLDADRGEAITHWRRSDELPNMTGVHQISAAMGLEMAAILRRGHSVIINDALHDPRTAWLAARYAAINVQSIARVPFNMKGALLAVLAVADERVRAWRNDEVTLLENVIARIWPLVIKARTEDALQASEARLNTILQNIPAAVYLLTPDHRYLYVNRYYEQDNHITNAEIRGQSVYDRHSPEEAALLAANEQQVLVAQTVIEFEESARRGGEERFYATIKAPLLDAAGKPYALLGISLDITARKQAEASLQQSELRFRTLANAMPQLVWTANVQGNVDYYNVRIEDYDPAVRLAAGGFDWARLVHPDDLAATFAAWQATSRQGAPYSFEHRLRMRDHSWRWHLSLAMPMTTADNQAKWYGSATDIHARKQIEEALKRREEQLRAIINAVPGLVAYVDQNERYQFVNAAYGQWFARPLTEIEGCTVQELIGAEFYQRGRPRLEQVLAGQEVKTEATFTYPDGVTRTLLVNYIPHLDAAGQPLGFYVVDTDISERKQAERNQQFLFDLDAQTRLLDDVQLILATVAADLGQYLALAHCTFNEIDLNADQGVALAHWRRSDNLPNMTGAHQISTALGLEMAATLRSGDSVVVRDAQHDPRTAWLADRYTSVGVQSIVCVPFSFKGALLTVLAVADDRPRLWRNDEVSLLENIIARIWPLVIKMRSDEALRQQEELLRQIADNVPGLIGYVGADERYRFVNATFETWFQRPRQQIIGSTVGELIGEKERERLSSYRQQVLAGEIVSYETVFAYPDGVKTVWGRYQPHLAADNTVLGFYLFLMDISERKQAEADAYFLAELAESIRLAENADQLLAETADRVGEYLAVGRAFFIEQDTAQDRGVIRHQYSPQLPRVASEYRLSSYNSATTNELAAGHTLVNPDAQNDPRTRDIYTTVYAPEQERAYIGVPLLHEGDLVAILSATSAQPRRWQRREIHLLETVAERAWLAAEKLRLDGSLRASEQRFRQLANAMPQIVLISDRTGELEFCNERWLTYTGRTIEESLAQGVWPSIHPDDVQEDRRRWATAVASGDLYQSEYRLLRHDGVYRWHLERAEPIYEGAQVVTWYHAATDIDEHKRIEANQQFLLNLNHALRNISDPEVIQQIIVQRLGEHLGASRCRFSRIDLVADQAILLTSWRQAGEPSAQAVTQLSQSVTPAYIHYAQTGQTLVVENVQEDERPEVSKQLFTQRRVQALISVPCLRNGAWVASLHLLQTTARLWRPDEVWLVEAVVNQCWPLLEKVRSEAQLRQSEVRYRALFAHASDAIFIAGDDGIYQDVNDAACLLSGYSRAELIGKTIRDLTPPAAYTHLDEDRQRLLAGQSQIDQWRLLRKDGTTIPIEVSVKQLPDSRWQAFVRDITERIRLEDELRELNLDLEQRVDERTAELERSNRELDQFAYVASHDLKAPLRAIDNLAQWIGADAAALLPTASQTHLEKLRGRVKRMEKLLDDLLAFSRAGRVRTHPERVDTGALVRDVSELLAPPADFSITHDDPMPIVRTERVPLETILRNLIGNAIKHHHRPDGKIHVAAQVHEETLAFSVTDDGPGIEAHYHQKIFEMFQTLKPRDQVEGSGMGLAVVKKLVESYGGTIEVESMPGQGATFRFTWPK